jgi:hypothetical protein
VPKNFFKPPKDLIAEWPEIFEDLYMNTMPVLYLELIRLEFGDGRIWEINVQEQLDQFDPDTLTDQILETLEEYHEDIQKINFKIDIEKLKTDISKSTKDLF